MKTPIATMTLSQYLPVYGRERKLKPSCIRIMGKIVLRFEQWYQSSYKASFTIEHFNEDTISEWVAYLHSNRHLQPQTLRGYRGHLLALWNHAFLAKIISHKPHRIVRVHVIRKDPTHWTEGECNRLLNVAKCIPHYFHKTGIKRSTFWLALINVCHDTSLSLDDALRLERGHIQEDGTVSLTTGNGVRLNRNKLQPATIELVESTFPPDRDLIFSWSYASKEFFKQFIDIAKAAGVCRPLASPITTNPQPYGT